MVLNVGAFGHHWAMRWKLRHSSIMERIEKVKKYNLQAIELQLINYQIVLIVLEIRHKPGKSIIVPRVSSERRKYIPIGFLDGNTIISDSAFALYDVDEWVFGLLTSLIHMTWVCTVAGRLKTDYRYSAAICYNTFPAPFLNIQQKKGIAEKAFYILAERERHSEKTLAQLYDPDTMPEGLREAHRHSTSPSNAVTVPSLSNPTKSVWNIFSISMNK